MTRKRFMRIRVLIWLIAAFAMLFLLSGCGTQSTADIPEQEQTSEITVSSSATVRLEPDKATISFGVNTQKETAEQAQASNAQAVDKVIAVLTENGVAEQSIRTTYYSMYPQYDYSGNGEQRLTGYDVSTTLSVQDQNIGDLGKLLSACVSAGVNNVDSVQFFCSGYDQAYQQALEQALADSRGKAEALAAAAGKELGEAVNVTEGWQDTSARYGKDANVSMNAMQEADGAGAPAFQPGESEIVANVTVTYRVK